jgi:Domain of unknown function (DUF4266)
VRRAPTLLAVLAAAALAGCALPTLPEPWVKPFERERLADPVMQAQRDILAARNTAHVREVREGARGAMGVQGGGCGCN